jgi:hypothetical protein
MARIGMVTKRTMRIISWEAIRLRFAEAEVAILNLAEDLETQSALSTFSRELWVSWLLRMLLDLVSITEEAKPPRCSNDYEKNENKYDNDDYSRHRG